MCRCALQGGQVVGNTLDGRSLSGLNHAFSCINAKGNQYLIQSNKCYYPRGDGFATHTKAPGWGANNVFKQNTCVGVPAGSSCVAIGSSHYPGAPKARMGNQIIN